MAAQRRVLLVAAAAMLAVSSVGLVVAGSTPLADLKAAMTVLMNSYDQPTAYWKSSWWNSAVATTTLIDYTRLTNDRTWLYAIDRTFEINKVAFPAGARSGDPILGNFTSRSIDDTEWWGLAWVAAYDLTGDNKYLTMSTIIANYVTGFWDVSSCGGGVWWDAERTYKNAITNGLYVRLVSSLGRRITGASGDVWRARAATAWNWFAASGMIHPVTGLVNDGLTQQCTNNGQTVWTYNQGLALGGAIESYAVTGNRSTLARALALADTGTSSGTLVWNGILSEACDALTTSCDDNGKQFKGIFMRYLGDLNAAPGAKGRYDSFIATQVKSLMSSDRDSNNAYGVRWNGAGSDKYPNVRDWRTQASAIEGLLAQTVGLTTTTAAAAAASSPPTLPLLLSSTVQA